MELWIRSQNKEKLIKSENLRYGYGTFGHIILNGEIILGEYKSKGRALEVLDEIQNKMKTLLYLKPTSILTLEDTRAAKKYFEDLNDIDLIATDNNFEIEPITTNVIVYQMPEE